MIASFQPRKALSLFGQAGDYPLESLPPFSRNEDGRKLKSWTLQDLPKIGEKIGYLAKPQTPLCLSVFVTKGGVLKTTLTLNMARMAALHNIRTCVVGLDMQGDITSNLGGDLEDENAEFASAVSRLSSVRGLADLFAGTAAPEDLIQPTDIPTLFYIPETPELAALDQSLMNRNRREYWLKEKVVAPLKEKFDLIILDCSPNWNRLITNALVASDFLISPLECKINNFRNLKTFRFLIEEFQVDLDADFKQIFVPTRLASNRRLSQDIFEWYQSNLNGVTKTAVRESLQGEEASALRVSIPELSPISPAAIEIRELLQELWTHFPIQTRELSMTHANENKERAIAMDL